MNPKRTFAVLPLAIAILLAAGLFLDREDSANAQNSGHGARTTEGTTREASPQSGSASTPTDRDAFASVVAGPGGGRIQPSVFTNDTTPWCCHTVHEKENDECDERTPTARWPSG